MSRCHACGKENCVGSADPVGGPYAIHNRTAYNDLLRRRGLEVQETVRERSGEASTGEEPGRGTMTDEPVGGSENH